MAVAPERAEEARPRRHRALPLARLTGWLASWATHLRRGAVPFPLMVLALAVAAAAFVSEMQRASHLEQALDRERASANVVQHMLVRETQQADVREQELQDNLREMEDEADHLYNLVRAIRTLGEQLRERVGIPGPAIEPLPDLPARPARNSVTGVEASPEELLASFQAAPAAGITLTGGLAQPASLPVDTGPWPESYVSQPPVLVRPVRLAHVAQVSDAVARQWDGWQQLGQTIDQVLNQRSRAARPSIRPAFGPITSGFGRRPGFWGALAIHTGVDMSLPIGTSVVATADGTVTFAGWSNEGYGQTVMVQHVSGLLTLYGHLSRPLVRVGQHVGQGQAIAQSGNTGISTGPHLHYEIRLNGTPIDPTKYW